MLQLIFDRIRLNFHAARLRDFLFRTVADIIEKEDKDMVATLKHGVTEEQIIEVARAVKSAGADLLRGAVFRGQGTSAF